MKNDQRKLSERDEMDWNLYISKLEEEKVLLRPIDPPESNHFSRRLDLHGLSIHEAWVRFREFVDQHTALGSKSLVVITGRSGMISREFVKWCSRIPGIASYEAIETRNGKAGSYRIKLRNIDSNG